MFVSIFTEIWAIYSTTVYPKHTDFAVKLTKQTTKT
jgi:hypothetical protein